VKDLLIVLLLLAGVGLFFHDKQQTNDLAKARADNDQLNQQLASYATAYNQLQARMRQPVYNPPPQAQSDNRWGLKTDTLKDPGPNPLNRPAY
jgi:hypothetical protein